jgi:hypothetical protein
VYQRQLNKEIDIPAIEKQIIPGFNIAELQKAKQPVHRFKNPIITLLLSKEDMKNRSGINILP